jgi:hypothetical protein
VADYYVDSDVAGPGSGTFGDPWDDIDSNLSSLSAGDTMILRGGGTPGARQDYNETLAITGGNGCANGSSGNEITITNYSGEYIRLYSAASTKLIEIVRDFWVIEGQAFDVDSGDPYFELDRQDVSSAGYAVHINSGNNNTLKYLHIHNGNYNPSLVRISNGSNNLISYCRIHDNAPVPGVDHHGVYISSSDSGTPADDNIVEYCRMYDCAGDCVQIQTSGTGTISDTIVRYCTLSAHATTGASETAVADKDGSGTLVYGNIMYGFRDCDGSIGGSGGDGYAMRFQVDSSGAQIYDNEIYDCSGAAIVIDGDNVVFHHNLVHDPTYEASIANKVLIYVTSVARNINLHNNTFVGGFGAGTYSYRSLATATVDLKNNIFKDGDEIKDDGVTVYDYNCWYNCTHTLSGSNDVTADPLFNDEGSDDYTLATNSPCINAGTDLGYSYEGSAPDMGAFESGYNLTVSVSESITVGESLAVYHSGAPPGSALQVSVSETVMVADVLNVYMLGSFPIRFETGDLSEWDTTVVSGGTLGVLGSAAREGSYGMYATFSSGASVFGRKENYLDKDEIRIGFWFDPNSVTMTDSESFSISTDRSNADYRVGLSRNGSNYEIYIGVYDDSPSWNYAYATLRSYGTAGWHWIEFHLKRSTGPGDNNGFAKLWIDVVDGTPDAQLTSVDDDTLDFDDIQVGACYGIDAGTSGTIYFDYIMGNDTGDVIGVPVIEVSTGDSVSVNDTASVNISAASALSVSVSDSITVTDAVVGYIASATALNVQVSDSVAVSDAASGSTAVSLQVSVSDSVGVVDTALAEIPQDSIVWFIDGARLVVDGAHVVVGT